MIGLHAVTARLPKRFYDDHVARDCAAGTIERETQRHYFVQLDLHAFDELLSDAEHYADPAMQRELDPEYIGLVTSARATVTALRKLVVPWSVA